MTYLYRRLQFKYLFKRNNQQSGTNEVDRPKESLERNAVYVVSNKRSKLLAETGDIKIIHDRGVGIGTDEPNENERYRRPQRKKTIGLFQLSGKLFYHHKHDAGDETEQAGRKGQERIERAARRIDKPPDQVAARADDEPGKGAEKRARKEANGIGKGKSVAAGKIEIHGKSIRDNAERDKHGAIANGLDR